MSALVIKKQTLTVRFSNPPPSIHPFPVALLIHQGENSAGPLLKPGTFQILIKFAKWPPVQPYIQPLQDIVTEEGRDMAEWGSGQTNDLQMFSLRFCSFNDSKAMLKARHRTEPHLLLCWTTCPKTMVAKSDVSWLDCTLACGLWHKTVLHQPEKNGRVRTGWWQPVNT